jgi:hypothetical protein
MSALFRTATPAERARYEGELYPLQDRILAVAATYGTDLVLTGGTGLARCYFAHRYSDDIDLFTLQPHAGVVGRDFANALRAAGLDVQPVIESSSFMRATISDTHASIQVDIGPDAPRVEDPVRSRLDVFVHTLRDLAANKIGAFESRSEAKDAVDLYHLARNIPWQQMFADAAKKRVPIAYGDLGHFLETPVTGVALLTESIEDDEFERFVVSLRDAITQEIKKKVSEQRSRVDAIVSGLLWDAPPELRTINDRTRRILERRAAQLPLPERIVLQDALTG